MIGLSIYQTSIIEKRDKLIFNLQLTSYI